MAIYLALTTPAAGIGCFSRPTYIGGFEGTTATLADADDGHQQMIVGTAPDGYRIQSGDHLLFEIMAVSSVNATFRCGVDLKFVSGPYLSDHDVTDTNGDEVAYHDRFSLIGEGWQPVTVSLENYVGMIVDQLIFCHDEDSDGTHGFGGTHGPFVFRLRSIVIQNAGAVNKVFWYGFDSGDPADAWGVRSDNLGSRALTLGVESSGSPYGTPVTISTGTSYSVAITDLIVINNSSTGAMTFNLPDSASLPPDKIYIFRNFHGSNNLTIDPFSTQTIDGSSTKTLTPGQSCSIALLAGSGSNWFTFAN